MQFDRNQLRVVQSATPDGDGQVIGEIVTLSAPSPDESKFRQLVIERHWGLWVVRLGQREVAAIQDNRQITRPAIQLVVDEGMAYFSDISVRELQLPTDFFGANKGPPTERELMSPRP